METKKICHGCQQPLAPNAPDGLCPACLMKAGVGTGVDLGPDSQPEGRRTPFVAPTLEEVARLFPQLEILGFLGQGGMGAVYKARQKELDRIVALKLLPPGIGQDPAFAERFTREARALARLNHPGIVTLYEFGRADGLFFFLMEFVDGVTLRKLLEAGRVAPREALAIVPQICDALQYAHDAGIVHRDIKPENILLDRRGRVKVADFGLAKLVESNAPLTPSLSPSDGERVAKPGEGTPVLTDVGKVMGTPAYMAPEQVDHPAEVDHRADIYALGVVFYQMLTGELPGRPLQPPSRKVQIDVRLDEVVMRALEQDPGRRYSQASVLKTQVETIVATPGSVSDKFVHEPLGATPDGTRGMRALPEPRFSRTAIVGAAWAPAFFLAFVAWFWQSESAPVAARAGEHLGPAWWQILLLIVVGGLGFTAFFGTTILGWVAVSQIRRSAGKLYGLGLAVFDGLLFPLLALDALMFMAYLMVAFFMRHLPHSPSREVGGMVNALGLGLVTLALIVWLDFLITRAVWRAVNKASAGVPPAEPGAVSGSSSNKRTFRWPMLLLVLILLAALDVAIWLVVGNVWRANPPEVSHPVGAFLAEHEFLIPLFALLVCAALDFFIIRSVLPALKKPVGDAKASASAPAARPATKFVKAAWMGGIVMGIILGTTLLIHFWNSPKTGPASVIEKRLTREIEAQLKMRSVRFKDLSVVLARDGMTAGIRLTNLQEMRGIGRSNVWVAIDGLLSANYVGGGVWEVTGSGQLGAVRLKVPAGELSLPAATRLTEAELAARAVEFVQDLQAGRISEARAWLHWQQQAVWSEERLREWWGTLASGNGKLLSIGTPIMDHGPLTRRATMLCTCERGRFGLRLSFFPSGEIEGITCLPQGVDVPPHPQTPSSGPVIGQAEAVDTTARSRFPKAAHIARDEGTVLVHHDDVDVYYALFYAGEFGSSVGDSHNTLSLTWLNQGSVKLKNGRTFGYLRESTDEFHLSINGQEFDLRQGRVLVLHDDGAVEQLKLFPPLSTANSPAALAKLIASARAMNEEPVTLEKLHQQLEAAQAQLRDLLKTHAPTHQLVVTVRQSVEALQQKITELTEQPGVPPGAQPLQGTRKSLDMLMQPDAAQNPPAAPPPAALTIGYESETMQNIIGALLPQKCTARLCLENLDFDQTKDGVTIAQAMGQLEETAKQRKLTTREQDRLSLARKRLAEGNPKTMLFDVGSRYSGQCRADSVDELLAQITRHTLYAWRKVGDTYVVLPAAGSRLAYPVTLSSKGLTVEQAVQKVVEQRPAGSTIAMVLASGMPVKEGVDPTPWLSAKAPALELKGLPAMEVLCRITEGARPDSVWELAGYRETRNLGILRAPSNAAASAPGRPEATFGPVIQRVIYDYKSGKDWLLNLETGDTFSLPPGLDWDKDAAAVWEWAHQHKVHVTGLPVVSQQALYGFEMKAAVARGTNLTFESITPLQVSTALRGSLVPRSSYNSGPWLFQLAGMDWQNLYAFQTDDGQRGVLQVIGMTENPRGVKIRYKLVQAGAGWTAAPSKTGPNPIEGPRFDFRWVAVEGDTTSPTDLLPDKTDLTGQRVLRVLKDVVLDSSAVKSAEFTKHSGSDGRGDAFSVHFSESGGRKFAEATAGNIGRRLAIVWNGRVLSAPVIQAAITGGSATITGRFTDAEAEQLLDVLNHRVPAKASATDLASVTEPASPATLGPVVEREVNDLQTTSENCALNFDSGKLLAMPANITLDMLTNPPAQPVAVVWARSNQVDAVSFVATADGKLLKCGLLCPDVVAIPADSSAWDQMTPAQLTKGLKRVWSEWGIIPQVAEVESDGKFPVTYLILATRTHRMCALQLIGVADNPLRLKIRYKLVTR